MVDIPASRNPEGVDALIEAWQQRRDQRAIEALLKQYNRFIVGEGNRAARIHGLDLDDSIQVAKLAFVHTVEKYDGSFNCSLMSYGRRWIRSHIVRKLLPWRGAVTTPINWLSDKYQVERASRHLVDEGLKPTPENITERLPGYSIARVTDIINGATSVSLDKPMSADGATFGEILPGPLQYQPDHIVERKLIAEGAIAAFNEAVATFPERQQLVARLRFEHEMTLEEVGKRIGGVTRERVRQIEAKLLPTLRAALASDPRVIEAMEG